jgi:hypothetical protein
LCIAACFGALLLGRFLPKLGDIFGCRHFFSRGGDAQPDGSLAPVFSLRANGACCDQPFGKTNAINPGAGTFGCRQRKFFLLSFHAIVMLCSMDLFKGSLGDDLGRPSRFCSPELGGTLKGAAFLWRAAINFI